METKLLTQLLACEISGKLPDASYSSLPISELAKIYTTAHKHDVAHLAADALKKANALPNGNAKAAFMKEYTTAIFRSEGFLHTIDEIKAAFDESGIPFILLKGAAIKKYYPEVWMRTSCDLDILVKKEDIERASEVFTSKLSYERGDTWTHDIAFNTPGNVHIELHFDTIEEYVFEKASKVLAQIWEYAVRVGDTQEYELTDDMLYFYHVVHAAKHFKIGGCGIRPLIDQYLLQKNIDISGGKKLLEDVGLGKFEEAMSKLAGVWFENEEMPDELKIVEEYIISGGVYGTNDNIVKMRATETGKIKYIFGRIFAPYDVMKTKYPVLEKHKWLMPLFIVVRPFDIMFHGRMKNGVKELASVMEIDGKTSEKYTELISLVGLDEVL